MSTGYQFLIFLLMIVPFISCLNTFGENENSIHHFPPNQKEVEECEKDISKCQNFSTYPRSHIEKLIKKNIIKKEWFKDDKKELTNLDYTDDKEYTSLCASVDHKIVYPQGKMTENREFIYIVQMELNDAYYYQSLKSSSCIDSAKQCCHVQGNSDNGNYNRYLLPKAGYTNTNFKCIQKRNKKNFIGVAVNGTVIRDVSLPYNSFCVCEYCDCTNCSCKSECSGSG